MNTRNEHSEPPSFERRLSRFETSQQARHRKKLLCAALMKMTDPRGRELARRLNECCNTTPCESAACPVCNRRFRKTLRREGRRILPAGAEIMAISLIPKNCRVELDGLDAFDLVAWARSRQRSLFRALPSEAWFLGGVDISLNTFENADPHWCFHIFGYVIVLAGWGVDRKRRRSRFRDELERRAPPIPVCDRIGHDVPLRVGPRDRATYEANLLYAYKSEFYHRSRYGYEKRVTNKRSTNSVAQRLKRAQRAQLAVFLDRYPLGHRLILVGLRRRGGAAEFALHIERDRQSPRTAGARRQVSPNAARDDINGSV